jgi:hypothetical protein
MANKVPKWYADLPWINSVVMSTNRLSLPLRPRTANRLAMFLCGKRYELNFADDEFARPDVTLIAIQTFVYVPDKLFEVITFEIKPNIDSAMEGVFETAAHSAFAHRSYLAFPDSKDYDNNPLFDRILDECERFGLGLILFEDVANWDTYTFEVSAERKDPDPQSVNDFIKGQISEKSREEIKRWFR